jgi:hypothetical protein
MPLITKEIIEKAKSINGGWSASQLKVIGVEWPPKKGWKEKVIREMVVVNDEQLKQFLNKRVYDN